MQLGMLCSGEDRLSARGAVLATAGQAKIQPTTLFLPGDLFFAPLKN